MIKTKLGDCGNIEEEEVEAGLKDSSSSGDCGRRGGLGKKYCHIHSVDDWRTKLWGEGKSLKRSLSLYRHLAPLLYFE